MKRFVAILHCGNHIKFSVPFCCSGPTAAAQSMDDMNLQVHGYATPGFIYPTNNNWNTADTTDGRPAWSEAMVSMTVEPQPKLRIGVQARNICLRLWRPDLAGLGAGRL